MTTFDLTIGFDWINVIDYLNLENDTAYFIQNLSDGVLAYSFNLTEPTETDGRHNLLPSARKKFLAREGTAFWVKSKKVGELNKFVRAAISDDATVIATESNGGVPVNIQDQTTRPVIAKFNQVQVSTTLAQPAVKGGYDIVVVSAAGIAVGYYIILFEPSTENFSFYTVLAIVGTTITLDTPVDFAYGAGTYVDAAITNLNLDGSVTPQAFGVRGLGSPPGVDLEVDITRLIFKGITDGAASLALFGDLPRLDRGLVLRKRNAIVENIFNVKDNGEFAGIMYDWEIVTVANPIQGVNGFYGRLTFAGQNKIGVTVRLAPEEDLELLIQDDLTDLALFEIMAQGHVIFK